MNKILIKDLLNNQTIAKEKNELSQINEELFKVCSFLPNYGGSIPESLLLEFEGMIAKLQGVRGPRNEVRKEARTTYQICKIMEEIIKHFPNEEEEEEDSTKESFMVFNIMTKKMMNKKERCSQSYRGHRFSSTNIKVLEYWYSEHYQKPYLTKSALEKLAKATGLNKIQIRNWISNRRRKEKSVQVSPAILKLVRDK